MNITELGGSAGSVRVNLSVPAEMDAVLSELAAITGRAKASYATEALSWYLPRLYALLGELRERSTAPTVDRLQRATGAGEKPSAAVGLSRQQKRAAERAARKAAHKGHP
jgi:hypothetical protein